MRLRPALLIAAALLGLGGCLGGLAEQGAEDAIEVSVLPAPGDGGPGEGNTDESDTGEGNTGEGGNGQADTSAGVAAETTAAHGAVVDLAAESDAAAEGPEAEAAADGPEATPPPPANPALARARAECAATGGRLVPVGSGGARLFCLRDTRDAGRQCRARGDCEGECLARSGTCAPVMPLFGCHEILNASGARVTECME